ncbi:MAG: hypothetical protein ACTHK4_04290, partial [Mycobacteriales bacterium]
YFRAMRSTFPVAVGITALLAVAGCSSSGSSAQVNSTSPPTTPASTASGPADPAAAAAAVKANWTAFFGAGNHPAAAVKLLQNGSQLNTAIKIAAKAAKKQKVSESANVTNVAFTSATTATVTYNLLSHGQVLLPGATGTAVLVNGQWLVSQSTFCTLVGLAAGGKTIPGC